MSTQNSTGNVSLPHMVDVDVFGTPKSQTNWDTLPIASSLIFNAGITSDGTQNDEIAWDVNLAPGTWTVELMHQTNPAYGIASVQLDSVEEGTIDFYAASGSVNVLASVTGIAIAEGGTHELKIVMDDKNASSSNYFGRLMGVRLIRTGA